MQSIRLERSFRELDNTKNLGRREQDQGISTRLKNGLVIARLFSLSWMAGVCQADDLIMLINPDSLV